MEVDNPSLQVILKTWLHTRYKKHQNPEMWRAHLYVRIGFAVFFLIALLQRSPPGVIMGVVLATAVFTFHEYMGQRVRNLLDFLSSRYNLSESILSSSSLFTTGIIASLDLIVAVPMFGYGDYSSVVGICVILLFAYWSMTKFSFRIIQDVTDYLSGHPHPIRFIVIWAGAFLVASAYLTANSPTALTLIELLPANSSSNTSLPGSPLFVFLTAIAILVVSMSILAVTYVIVAPIIVLFVFILLIIYIPYSLLYEPQLLLGRPEGMSFSLRLWATVSILIIYGSLSLPLYFLGLIQFETTTETKKLLPNLWLLLLAYMVRFRGLCSSNWCYAGPITDSEQVSPFAGPRS